MPRNPELQSTSAGDSLWGAWSSAKSSTFARVADDFSIRAAAIKPTTQALPTILDDEAGNSIGGAPGNPVIIVDDPVTHIATINTIGDKDFFQVTLEAGKSYQIGQYQAVGGPNGVPLPDAYLELYDSAGHLITSADGGGPNTPSGLDASLTYEVTTTGTYYINFMAFDQDSTNGTDGDGVGDYEYFVKTVDPNDPNVYHPYYDTDSPLYAIDWGTLVNRIHQSEANPDGNEGTRDTGNPAAAPGTVTGDTLGHPGKNVITIYFAKEGDTFTSNDPTNPGLPPVLISVGTKPWEKAVVFTALHEFEKVADVVYVEVPTREEADFFFTTSAGTPGPGVSLLGSMSPPDESDEGLAQFNSGDYRWTEANLAQGGFSYVTLIHEFGHGHGLAHPHDNGGHSGIMHGVEEEPLLPVPGSPGVANYTTGDFDLNQGVFTMMSYEDGWQTSPYGNAPTDAGYGYMGGLMAFDIAAIQDKYGVNEETATGNDTYALKDVNAAGTYYTSIWDAGGIDEIVYGGSKDATIDLRPATLQYEYGGGGWMSYAYGIYGGYTIASGVTIENATGGSGNDVLTGNAVDNILTGNAGNDRFNLQYGGNDTANGGAGNDGFYFGAALTAADIVAGGADTDTVALQGNYTGGVTLTGISGVEVVLLASGSNDQFGDTADNRYSYNVTSANANVAAGGVLSVIATGLLAGENVTFNGAAETDGGFRIFTGQGIDNLVGGSGNDGFFFGADGNLTGADQVDGGAGTDTLALRGTYAGGPASILFQNGSFSHIEVLALLSGHSNEYGGAIAPGGYDYDLTTANGNVAAGTQLDVNGAGLRADETLRFDGRAELDGSFRILAGAADDTLYGGSQADILYGGLGADRLEGGPGADTYWYRGVAESTSTGFDTIAGFDAATDRIDLNVEAGGFAAVLTHGALSAGSFDADLTAALNGLLGAGQSALFTADSGSFAGRTFAIVDANGQAGYQAGQDFVIELANPTGPLGPGTDIFV
jgi:hypothetical protein